MTCSQSIMIHIMAWCISGQISRTIVLMTLLNEAMTYTHPSSSSSAHPLHSNFENFVSFWDSKQNLDKKQNLNRYNRQISNLQRSPQKSTSKMQSEQNYKHANKQINQHREYLRQYYPYSSLFPHRQTAASLSPRIITTHYGKIRGVLRKVPKAGRVTKNNLKPSFPTDFVETFYGIQYATVFKGKLRFMPPTSSLEKWTGLKTADNFAPVCPQHMPDFEELKQRMPRKKFERIKKISEFLKFQDEECLFLNIFIPFPGNFYLFHKIFCGS